MCQWFGSAFVQIMACRLIGAKPLSRPILGYVNWPLRNELQWDFNKNTKCTFSKVHMNISSAKWRPFSLGGDELILILYSRMYCLTVPNVLVFLENEDVAQRQQEHESVSCSLGNCRTAEKGVGSSFNYNDVIMSVMASQITSLTSVCSTVYSGSDQRKHQSSASLAFVRGIHRWPVNSPHKGPVTRKMFPVDDVIMY